MDAYHALAASYDRLTNDVDYEATVEFYMQILQREGLSPRTCVDLACGTGSVALLLAKKGLQVTAVDMSEEMLSIARESAMEQGNDILFLCQRLEELDLYGTVDGAVCCLDSLNHITDYNTLCKAIKRISLFLEKDKLFIFDVNTPYKHEQVLGNNTFIYDEKDVFCVWQNRLLQDNKTVNINLDFFVKDGNLYQRFNENFNEIAFTDEEITSACENEGFRVVKRYRDMGCGAPQEDTERVYYVIRREY